MTEAMEITHCCGISECCGLGKWIFPERICPGNIHPTKTMCLFEENKICLSVQKIRSGVKMETKYLKKT